MTAMIASLAVLPLLFLWKLLLTNRILVGLDAFNYFYPYHDFAATALGAGHLPLWNPHLFLGVPFLGDSQAQLLYPPNWPLLWYSAPSALNLSIALHLVVAAIGTWLLARRGLRLQAGAAWVAATIFALGGYVGSQAEHPNQLAAASWLPWLLLGVSRAQRRPWCGVLLTAVALALSFLAGHAQTTFISVAALALWVLGSWATAALGRLTRPPGTAQERTGDGGRRTDGEGHAETQRRQDAGLRYVDARRHVRGAAAITLGALLAVALAAAQLVPTAELSALSVRASGLSYREAVSFSYDPRLWPRTLLPTFGSDTRVLSEFVAYVGFSGALLGLLGLLFAWRRPGGLAALLLSASGLFLAPAVINPLYPLLWRLFPGFALFRAPARWLLLYALGSAILAGLGAGWLLARSGTMPRSAWLRLGSGTLLAMAAAGLSLVVADLPARGVLTWWLLAVAGALALLVLPRFPVALRVPVLMLVVGGELLLASRALDYNKATAPEAYSALRPAPAHLLTMRPPAGQSRLLSLSDLTWDPGDLADLNARHAAVLGQEAIYDFVVATKLKEVLAPNQPLRWGLSSADGYGGGLLPLETYTTLQTLLPLTKVVPDGRLRERLTAIPDRRWLDLLGVEWVVADKVRDLWIEGVYHDLGTPRVLRPDETLRWLVEPSFPADGVSLMVAGPLPEGVTVAIRVNEGAWVPLSSEHLRPAVDAWFSARLPLPAAFARTVEMRLSPAEADGQLGAPANLALGGLTLTNSRLGSFEALPASPNFRTTLSGDVKLYRRGDALGRAWVVAVARRAPPGAVATSLADPAFDPRSEVVLAGGARGDASGMLTDAAPTTSGSVTWLREAPEALVLRVTTDGAGWLVLADNWFPGWVATVDGTPVAIEHANLFARAVPIPSPGMHVVEFHYRPRSLVIGTTVTTLALLALLGLTVNVTADRK